MRNFLKFTLGELGCILLMSFHLLINILILYYFISGSDRGGVVSLIMSLYFGFSFVSLPFFLISMVIPFCKRAEKFYFSCE